MTEQSILPNDYVIPKRGETTVESYEFEPIKGYPMLKWKGKRPFTSTQFYPAQLREVYGDTVSGWRNKIFWGDNLQVMSHLLKEYRGKITLCVIDPPFSSDTEYKMKIALKGKLLFNDQTAFEEKQYTDIWVNDEYLQFMYDRLVLIKELLNENGSIYLHCDYREHHHLRCILDEIFGAENFANDIVWNKLTSAKAQSGFFSNVVDNILFYTKSKQTIFNPQYIKSNEDGKNYPYTEEKTGRKYGSFDFTQSGQGPARNFGNDLLSPPPGKHWIWSQDKINSGLIEGRIIFTSSGLPRVKRYLDEKEGNYLGDLWNDDEVKPLSANSSERLGYPTQKPEGLLTRIIKASSNPGDIVFDCFMGSGTALAAAVKIGRKFIGADINIGAIQTTTKRILNTLDQIPLVNQQFDFSISTQISTGFEIFNVNHYDVFRNPVEAKDLLLDAMEVQRLSAGQLFDGEKDGRLLKIMPVNRIATRADLSELITGFDYKAFDRRLAQNPGKPVEKITLVCMGHEPDLAAYLKNEVLPYYIDVEVVDILRDKQDLQFKRDSEAKVGVKNGQLVIGAFYPMNLLQKLSLQQENVTDWRELVESIMIDWNYDGAVLQPIEVDIPEGNDLVKGKYPVPKDAGTIRVKITDLLSESLEIEVKND